MLESTTRKGNVFCGTIFPVRYFVASMGSVGMAIIYVFRINISIGIVAMVNHTAIGEIRKDHTSEDGPFVWDKIMQGHILSAYFVGYLISMVPGARLAETVSAKWVINMAVFLNIAASALSPISVHGNYLILAFLRAIQGLGSGVCLPAMHVMVSKWGPPAERNVLASIIYGGASIGAVIAISLSGLIAVKLGWIWIFYVESVLCLPWCFAWWLMVEDSPERQKMFITQEEREYILNSIGESDVKRHSNLPVPWKQIFKSSAFLAIFFTHICNNFGWYMLSIEMPLFMNQVLRFELQSNALLSALPYLSMWIFTMVLAKVLEIMVQNQWLTVILSRKIGTFFASVIPMICLLAVTFCEANRIAVVAFMTISVTCMGGMHSGFMINHIDIAPNFAGTLIALTNAFGTISGIIVPFIVAYITDDTSPIKAWNMIFYLTAGIFAVEIMIFWTFGTANEQPWNKVDNTKKIPLEQDLPLENIQK